MNISYPWLRGAAEKLALQVQNPPQALCLVGAAGLGQEALADDFVCAVLDRQQPENHPDFLRITPEPGKSIGIDIVREIHDFCLISPSAAKRKILRIDQADSLSLPAQQAFLKTLEEPVIKTSFILTTCAPHKLLPTLRSRCQLVTLASVTFEQAKPWFDSQHLNISSKTYQLCDGGPLLVGTPEFESREQAYSLMTEYLMQSSDLLKSSAPLRKSEPLDVLTGFYYALMHQKRFALLDTCVSLRKQYSENPHLNWEMQLNSFLIEVKIHAG